MTRGSFVSAAGAEEIDKNSSIVRDWERIVLYTLAKLLKSHQTTTIQLSFWFPPTRPCLPFSHAVPAF